jgi:signal transduction histidine kinase
MAENKKKRWRFPGLGWLSSRLSRKAVALLLALAIFNCILMLLFFLSRLGTGLEVLCNLSPEEAHAVRLGLLQNALGPLILLTLGIFLVMAATIFLLIVAPIVRLRYTMRRYYESGQQPERTARLDEVGRLQNTFADLVGIVERKEQAERQLIASISQDIKTPLTSVMGYSERLRSADLPPEKQRQYLCSIYEKAVAIKSIVDEFDEYLDAGLRDAAPMRLMTAQGLCDQLRDEYADELTETGVDFSIACTCPREQLLCNWEHMRRCFGNLIGNSLQHCGAKEIRLDLICHREEDQIVFLFADNGQGVAPKLLEQIFEPLYTSDKGRKVSGLGLSICRSIVRAHGGSISAANLSPGLQIRIALPRVDA